MIFPNYGITKAKKVKSEIVKGIGFFIVPSELFSNIIKKARHAENSNKTLEKVFNTKSEEDFSGRFDDTYVNSNKLGSTVAKGTKNS